MSNLRDLLPDDAANAQLVGRIWDPAAGGPCMIIIIGEEAVDISTYAPTVATLCQNRDPMGVLNEARGSRRRWSLDDIQIGPDTSTRPCLIAPVDLQVLKACGVTFVESMLERVIEEKVHGDASAAARIRGLLTDAIGGKISSV